MATKSFSGQLDRPLNTDPAGGDKIFFYPLNTVGEIIESAASIMEIDSSGNYSITLGYNNYSLYYYSDVSKKKTFITTVTVSADTTVSTLPDLIGSTTPITSEVELAVQGYLADAEQARDDAQTAAIEAEAAQAATEALFDTGFDSNVATSVGLAATPYPGLHIPFNDGLRIESGYGKNDTITVDGTDYDLPTMSVDFARTTKAFGINKSGNLTEVSADSPIITSNGIWLHESFTNICTYSEFDGGVPISSSSRWSGSTFEESGITFDEWTAGVVGSNFSSTASSHSVSLFVYDDGTNSDLGERVLFYVDYRDSDVTSLISADSVLYNYTTGEVSVSGDSYGLKIDTDIISDNVKRITARSSYDGGDNEYISVLFATYTGKVGGVQVAEGGTVYPYVRTTSASATVTATSCYTQSLNNVPSRGSSFTFVFDAEFVDDDTETYTMLSCDTDASGGVILFRKSLGTLYWYFDREDGSDAANTTSNTDYTVGRHRYALVFNGDDGSFTWYCDGTLINARTPSDYCWFDVDGSLNFQPSYNNKLDKFKIYHQALTADQVKALGTAE